MIRLHGRWHGREYWRDLLTSTAARSWRRRTRSGGAAAVDRPTLTMEGQNDRVNATGHGAEFIAAHVREAEIWRPAEVGHPVTASDLRTGSRRLRRSGVAAEPPSAIGCGGSAGSSIDRNSTVFAYALVSRKSSSRGAVPG